MTTFFQLFKSSYIYSQLKKYLLSLNGLHFAIELMYEKCIRWCIKCTLSPCWCAILLIFLEPYYSSGQITLAQSRSVHNRYGNWHVFWEGEREREIDLLIVLLLPWPSKDPRRLFEHSLQNESQTQSINLVLNTY